MFNLSILLLAGLLAWNSPLNLWAGEESESSKSSEPAISGEVSNTPTTTREQLGLTFDPTLVFPFLERLQAGLERDKFETGLKNWIEDFNKKGGMEAANQNFEQAEKIYDVARKEEMKAEKERIRAFEKMNQAENKLKLAKQKGLEERKIKKLQDTLWDRSMEWNQAESKLDKAAAEREKAFNDIEKVSNQIKEAYFRANLLEQLEK